MLAPRAGNTSLNNKPIICCPVGVDQSCANSAMSVLRLSERRINIIGEGIDLAVRMGTLDDSNLVARRLSTVRRLLVASPAYLEKAGKPVAPSDLASHNAIVTSAALDTWRSDGGWECSMRSDRRR